MADKDKKKLKVILKLPKSSSQQKSSAQATTVAAGGAAAAPPPPVAKSAPVAFSAPASQSSAGHDYRNRILHAHHHAGATAWSSALSTHPTGGSASVRSTPLSGWGASAAAGSSHVSSALSQAPTPPKKRKFKTVEQAGALGESAVVVGNVSAAVTHGHDFVKDVKAGPGGGGPGTAFRPPLAPAAKKSHKKQVKAVNLSDGHPVHPFAGVILPPQAPTEPISKSLLEGVLDKLQKKDTYGVFAEPVDASQVPDYYDIISEPMDFGTMRKKIKKGSYTVLEKFEGDIYLICSNAMRYNGPETIYYKQARAIRDMAKKALEGIRSQLAGESPVPVSHKKKPPPSKKSHPKKAASSKFRHDGTRSDFASGATMVANGDPKGWSNSTVESGKVNKGIWAEKYVGMREDSEGVWAVQPGGTEMKVDALEDGSAGASGFPLKAMGPKDGRRPLSTEEYHRNTYKQRLLPAHGQGPPLAAVGGELRQLVAEGSHMEHAYAKSLAQFGSVLGPSAWRFVARKLQKVLAPNVAFGPGWVGEAEAPAGVLKLRGGDRQAQNCPSDVVVAGLSSLNTSDKHVNTIAEASLPAISVGAESSKSPSVVGLSLTSSAPLPPNASNLVLVNQIPTSANQSSSVVYPDQLGKSFIASVKTSTGASKGLGSPKHSSAPPGVSPDVSLQAIDNPAIAGTDVAPSSALSTSSISSGVGQLVQMVPVAKNGSGVGQPPPRVTNSTSSVSKFFSGGELVGTKVPNSYPGNPRQDFGVQSTTGNASANFSEAVSSGPTGGAMFGYSAGVPQFGVNGGNSGSYPKLTSRSMMINSSGSQHTGGADPSANHSTTQGAGSGSSNHLSESGQGLNPGTSNYPSRHVQVSGSGISNYPTRAVQGSNRTGNYPAGVLQESGMNSVTSYPSGGAQVAGTGSVQKYSSVVSQGLVTGNLNNYHSGGAQSSGGSNVSNYLAGVVQQNSGAGPVNLYQSGVAQNPGGVQVSHYQSGVVQSSSIGSGSMSFPAGSVQGTASVTAHYPPEGPEGPAVGPSSNYRPGVVKGSSVNPGASSNHPLGVVQGSGTVILSNYPSGHGTKPMSTYSPADLGVGAIPASHYSSGFSDSGSSAGLNYPSVANFNPGAAQPDGVSSSNFSSGASEVRSGNQLNYVPQNVLSSPGAGSMSKYSSGGIGQAGLVAGSTFTYSTGLAQSGHSLGDGTTLIAGDDISSYSSGASHFGTPSNISVSAQDGVIGQNSEKLIQSRSQYVGISDLQERGGRLEDITSGVMVRGSAPKQIWGIDSVVPDHVSNIGRIVWTNSEGSCEDQGSRGMVMSTNGKGFTSSWNPTASMHVSTGYPYSTISSLGGHVLEDQNPQAWALARVKGLAQQSEVMKMHNPLPQGFHTQSTHLQSNTHSLSSHPQSANSQIVQAQITQDQGAQAQNTQSQVPYPKILHPQNSHPQSPHLNSPKSQGSYSLNSFSQTSQNPNVQSSHLQNSPLKPSVNSPPILNSHMYVDYNSLGPRHPSQQSTGLSLPSGLNSQLRSQQPDSFIPVSGTKQRAIPSLQSGALQNRAMPPDLNVALLSPSALQSPSAQQVSTPPNVHQPDLKLQL